MFDPFFTQKSGGRGSGLGLIGVRPLVEGARGGLAVDSTPGNGTRVTLYLPCEAAGEVAPSSAAAPPRRSSPLRTPVLGMTVVADLGRDATSARILLVDDELPVREQLARLLDSLGYPTVSVSSATEARAVLSKTPAAIRAVVSDVMMPGESGIVFAEWLRTHHPDLPILLISGHTGTALDREARSSSDFELLRKPFSRVALAEKLELMLGPRGPRAPVPAD